MPAGGVTRRKRVVGDLRSDDKVWRRWSGRRWAVAAYSLDPARLRTPARFDQDPEIDQASRERALALSVEDQVAGDTATVVYKVHTVSCRPTVVRSRTSYTRC